ncbi:MAG: AI-2E family transporter [Rhodocyclaceae bacterium]|nr:AI-2E family transporter [Rhodocyclaceae bacterium]
MSADNVGQTEATHRTGPLVWASIIAVTCILLFLFQKILWLVVPILLALILYYVLVAPLQWLIYRGVSREAAASIVTLGFMSLLAVASLAAIPRVISNLTDLQNSVSRYVDGGSLFMEHSLRGLEASSSILREAHLADTVAKRLAESSGSLAERIEPIVVGLMTWTPSLLLAPFLAFFFLRDGRRFAKFLTGAVPNAYFERTLFLLHGVDKTLRAYFQGLIQLTILDAVTLAVGLWFLGIPGPWLLGTLCAVLAWIPYVGTIAGGLLVVLVVATDFPGNAAMAYSAVALFIFVRLLDDFVYMPLTIGKSLHMHPLVTVLMIFIGGAVAGVSGLMLVLPLLGVVMVIGETVGELVTDERLLARHHHARALRKHLAAYGLSRAE